MKPPKATIWHPFTQHKLVPPPLKVSSAYGAVLKLADGREIIDAISSWWSNLHGHCHPRIADAIGKQAHILEHVIFGGCTHEPAETLAEELCKILPESLTCVFYSDNGSTAVEAALKMAYQYWRNIGDLKRKTFLCFRGGYHGDTLGAMSLAGPSFYTKVFSDLMFDVKLFDYPETFLEDQYVEEKEKEVLTVIENELSQHKDTHVAVVIEPLVQGNSGMRMVRGEFLQQLRSLCDKYNVLLIFDEVMTGFGRTGELFASTKAKTCPDIICLSKGISGGFLPLAATCCKEMIYNAFFSEKIEKTFLTGHTYSGNPLACSAAIASLQLLQENPKTFQEMEKRHLCYLEDLKHEPNVSNLRIMGSIVAFDLIKDGETGYGSPVSLRLRERFLKYGVLIRPLGNSIYLMPPYCIEEEQLALCYRAIKNVIREEL